MATDELIECWQAWSGVPEDDGCVAYDEPLFYEDWSDLVADLRSALAHGREVCIGSLLLSRDEYDAMIWASDESKDDEVKQFRGEIPKPRPGRSPGIRGTEG